MARPFEPAFSTRRQLRLRVAFCVLKPISMLGSLSDFSFKDCTMMQNKLSYYCIIMQYSKSSNCVIEQNYEIELR